MPVTPQTPPNPNLSLIEERDIVTPKGVTLTLINPAYMTRQVFELADKEKDFVKGHITSLNPIRKENAPDKWEENALKAFASGTKEVVEIQNIGGQNHMRLMQPFVTGPECMKCHAGQGYNTGDIRGGISVSVPMSIFTENSNKLVAGTASAHFMIWLLGVSLIVAGSRRLDQSSYELEDRNCRLMHEIEEREVAQEQLQEQALLLEEEITERQKTQQLLEHEVGVRKQAEESAENNLSKLKLIMDSTYAAMYGVDTSGACIFVNKTAIKMTGYDHPDELISKNMHELIHHTRADGSRAPVSDCKVSSVYREGKTIAVNDDIFWKKDGHSFPVEYSSSPIINNGVIEGAVVSFIDISERKQAESKLMESNNFNQQIVNSAQEGIIVYDKDLRYAVWNPYMETITGLKAADVLGRHPLELFPFLKENMMVSRIEQALSGIEVETIEFPFQIMQSGKSGVVSDTCSALRNSDGTIVGVIGIIRDITAQKKLEEQFRHSQKMEAIGLLAGGVAHDFNNILTVIGGYSNLLQMTLDRNDPSMNKIDQIAAASERATNLTRSLLAFSRKMEIQLKKNDLNEIIAAVGKFLSRIIGEDICLTTTLHNKPLWACVDRGQIEQILMNLATNARDAMQNGGIFSISTEIRLLDPVFMNANNYGSPGNFAVIKVSDTGSGMDEETRRKIFDPFFTTKSIGKGTGLGMSIVYGIVSQHNGFINVSSSPGAGTTFEIFIPMEEQNSGLQNETELQSSPETGSETILVVEDDDNILSLAESFLTSLGYSVIRAENGEAGVDRFSENRDKIALVLMDMIMPKKSGKQACSEMRGLMQEVRVLFMNGYAANSLNSEQDCNNDITDFISKPLSLHELAGKIRKMLDTTI